MDEQVDKENMIPTDTHKFSFTKEGNPDIYNMSELRGYYAGWNNPDKEKQNVTCMNTKNKNNKIKVTLI